MQLVKHHSSTQIMQQVIFALLPVAITMFFMFGFSVILQIIFATLTAIIIDLIIAKLHNKPLWFFAKDYSSILTALLLALSIPSIAPFWIIIVGVSFALIFAKYIYGGLGNNIFNPAMVGYVFLIISYPAQMAEWQNPNLFISITDLFSNFDSISGATWLDSVRHNITGFDGQDKTSYIAIASIVGGIYLILQKIITWHIPVFATFGAIITILLIGFFDSGNYPFIFHLFAGGFMFAIFFIATDPVSTCATIKGKIIFALTIGMLIILIRSFGNYPDGVAFAVLITNMFVPLIDYLIRRN